MSFDVSVLFKIAAIGIAIALLNMILTKAGREEGGHDDYSRRSHNSAGHNNKHGKRIL